MKTDIRLGEHVTITRLNPRNGPIPGIFVVNELSTRPGADYVYLLEVGEPDPDMNVCVSKLDMVLYKSLGDLRREKINKLL